MPIVTTNFDVDGEGWTVRQNLSSAQEGVTETGTLLYQDSGGNSPDEPNPDGVIEYTDNGGGTAFFNAPDSYLGDHSGKYNGYIEYSLYITDVGANGLDNNITNDIIVTGANGIVLTYDIPTPSTANSWVTINVPFNDGNWINQATGQPATEEEVRSVLEDISEFAIAAEYSTSPLDVTHLDTVSFVCFAAGTMIKTIRGDIAVEKLEIGDKVITLDGSSHPIRWIGSRLIISNELEANPKLRPVKIAAGALGQNLPIQDLLVSRQHRVLARSPIAKRVFGIDEVLIPAIKLTDLPNIELVDNLEEVEYFHLLFDHHQIIFSNGAPTESLFTGPEALKSVSREAREEIESLFPEIIEPEFTPKPARLIPEAAKDVKKLIMRHRKNNKPLLNQI